MDAFGMVMPFFVAGCIVMFIVNVLQVKWKVTTKPLKADFKKFNPINGFKRFFSKDSLIELLKAFLKIIIIVWVAYSAVVDDSRNLLLLYDMSLIQAVMFIGSVIINAGMKISIAYCIIGIADYIYQKWKFKEDMKMTKQEVKDEYKNSEGDPQ